MTNVPDNIHQYGKSYTISRLVIGDQSEAEMYVYKDIIQTLINNGVLLIDWQTLDSTFLVSWMLEGVKQHDKRS